MPDAEKIVLLLRSTLITLNDALQTGNLTVKGYFPGQPVQIDFEMLYEAVGGRWQLFGISVNPSQAQPPASATPPVPSPN
jgi:hypothetical protein